MSLALSVRNLSKSYTIAHNAMEKESTLTETIVKRLKNPFHRAMTETFWALKDINFDVKKGEVLGIIGRNGAGKSTLLKILSRITEPTTGEINLYGRVGSLLEVGTGFHPELTGRENIFLNGAILGMTRAEIKKQFDAIVDFAGVEKFLDTPVKRYSSGMYVRLAFAVAAHLRTEILIVDEVLAVGDAEFQKKCLGKMHDVAHDGRTVLFVSHNMAAIAALCGRVVVMQSGSASGIEPTLAGIRRYTFMASALKHEQLDGRREGTGARRYLSAASAKAVYAPAEPIEVNFAISCSTSANHSSLYLSGILATTGGVEVCQLDSRRVGEPIGGDRGELLEGTLVVRLPWLMPGHYCIHLYICSFGEIVDRVDCACTFEVAGATPHPFESGADSLRHGLVVADYQWEVRPTVRAVS
jgi:lipopolysaccharide transport system ATP-binding protein